MRDAWSYIISVLLLIVIFLPDIQAAYNGYKTCEVGSSCDFVVFTMNRTNETRFVNTTTCNVSIFSPTDYSIRLLNNQSMNQPNASFGMFNYSYTFASIGHYPAYVGCNGVDTMILSSGHNDHTISTTLLGTIADVDSGGDLVDVSVDVINTTTILNSTSLFITSSSVSDWPTAVIIALLTIVGVLTYYSIKLVNLSEYLRLLMFLIAFLILLITINVAVQIVTVQSSTSTNVISLLNTTYEVLLWVFLFVFAILFILFLFGTIDNWKKRKGDITP